MWPDRRNPMLETPQNEGSADKEKAMFNDPESHLRLARQRQRELMAQAEQDRQAKAARQRSRSDTKNRDRN
jgi:hypothetical protein